MSHHTAIFDEKCRKIVGKGYRREGQRQRIHQLEMVETVGHIRLGGGKNKGSQLADSIF